MAPTGRVDYTATNYNKTAPFVYCEEFTTPILKWLNPATGDRLIDLGCGSGELTAKIQDAVGPTGFVVGVDHNQDMASENGVKNVLLCDIQDLNMLEEKSFDAVFSNAALHWCKSSPSGVLEGVKRMLKDAGRFIGEMGGYLNVIGIRTCLHRVVREHGLDPETMDPWYFPTIEEYQKLLENACFQVDAISLVPRITQLKHGGLRDWLQLFVRGTFLKTVGDEDAAMIMDEVTRMCEVDCKDKDGNWSMVYVRLRFSATIRRPNNSK